MTDAQDVPNELGRLLASGHLSEEALAAMTGIQPAKLGTLLQQADHAAAGLTDPTPLSAEENTRVSVLAALLTHVAEVDDDERLRGILESLTVECRLTLENIAQLTSVDIDDLMQVVDAPGSVSAATKFTIALRSSYLISAVNLARPR